MKLLAILISIIFCSFKAQDDDTRLLYVMALKNHLPPDDKNVNSASTIFLINEDVVDLPEIMNNHPIKLVGDSALSFLQNKPSFRAIKIHPIGIRSGKIIILLSDYVVTKGSEGANFSYAGGKEYIFSYNGSTKKYSIIQTKVISY